MHSTKTPLPAQAILNSLNSSFRTAVVFSALFALPSFVYAQSASETNTKTDDTTDVKESSAVAININHRSDLISNLQGGLKRGSTWLGYTDLKLGVDLEKAIGLNHSKFYTQFHSELGGKPNAKLVGSYMGINNIEVNTNTAQLSQFWFEKTSADGELGLLFGLYALDSEFYVTDSSGVFLQPPLGIGTSIGQTGKNGPPIFPRTSAGLRFKYQSPSQNYFQAAIMDGVPGDPNNFYGTRVKFEKGDGTISIVEVGHLGDKQGTSAFGVRKLALGYWKYSSPYPDLVDLDAKGEARERQNHGWYLLGEFSLFSDENHPQKNLTSFFRFGTASRHLYQVDWSVSTGLNYSGFLNERPHDVLAFGITNSHTSNKFRSANSAENHESIVELTYKYQYNQHLAIQPLVQYVVNPNMDRSIKNALVAGVRFDLNF